MSGHNKWSKIKHKKALSDAKKSQVFSKLIKLIQVESRVSGGDMNSPNLKTAIEKAKKENIPKDNILRAVKKGLSSEGNNLENVRYEAYGPCGVAIIIEALTDNRNRAGAEIKHILSEAGTSLSAPGSVIWAFDKKDGRWLAKTFVQLDSHGLLKLKGLIETLEDQEDVQEIFVNTKNQLEE